MCQEDNGPELSNDPAGYLVSYMPTGPFLAGNLTSIMNSSSTQAAYERKRNHTTNDPDTGMQVSAGYPAYADGHVEKPVPGIKNVGAIVFVGRAAWSDCYVYEVEAYDVSDTNVALKSNRAMAKITDNNL